MFYEQQLVLALVPAMLGGAGFLLPSPGLTREEAREGFAVVGHGLGSLSLHSGRLRSSLISVFAFLFY